MRASGIKSVMVLSALVGAFGCNNGDDPGAVDTAVGTEAGGENGGLRGGIESPSGTGEGMPAVGTSRVTTGSGATMSTMPDTVRPDSVR